MKVITLMAILIAGILSGVASNAFAAASDPIPGVPDIPGCKGCPAAAEKIRGFAEKINNNPNIPDTQTKSDLVGKLNARANQLETGVGCSFLDPRGC